MIGQTFSHYRITGRVGGGGMGVVYKAEDTTLKRTVALKFLPPELTRDDEAKQRFIHEAQAASALQHNNICTIHDIGETGDGQMFMVMDLYEGETLKKKIEIGRLPFDEAIDIAVQIARGLSKAHEKGIIHRDIKPANILVTNEGVVKVVDFGLAKLLGAQQITKEGRTLGTTMYMSPEQLKGEEIDALTDIWSFGVLLYQMLTGQLPFRAEFDEAVIYQINCEQPPAMSSLQPAIPKEICQLVAQCLEKDKQRRPPSMGEIMARLGHETEGRPAPFRFARHTTTLFVAGVIVASLALVFYFAGDLGFTSPPKELRLAVLTFIDETRDTAIVGYKPEIQRMFVNDLFDAGKVLVDDRLRFNDALSQEFGTESPSRTNDLFSFLRKNSYDFVVDGGITRSSKGGHTVQANLLKKSDGFQSGEKFEGHVQWESQLDSVVGDLCSQMLAYLRVTVLETKSEMGVWKRHTPKNWAAVAKLEDAYRFYSNSERRLANSALLDAVQLDSTFISPRVWLASYQRWGDPEGGKQNLQTLLRLKPEADDFERAMIDWVDALLNFDYPNQIRFLKKGLKEDQTNRILLANLAGVYTEMHDTLHALEAYRYCIESRWDFKPMYQIATRCYLALQNLDAAREGLMVWWSLDTTSTSPLLYGWLTAIAARQGNAGDSTRWMDRFLMVCVDSTVAKKNSMLGGFYADAGLFMEGESMLRQAVSMEPKNAEFRERLGDALCARGGTESALREYTIAAELKPSSRTLKLKLGNLYKLKGEITQALEHYRRYLKVDSLSFDAQLIQKWMREENL